MTVKKKPIIFKVAGREIELVFLKTNEKDVGKAVLDEEKIKVSGRDVTGHKRSLRNKLAILCHELSHVCSQLSGHEIFEDEDKKLTEQKEHALDGFSELLTQVLYDSGMLNKEWLERFDSLDETEDNS